MKSAEQTRFETYWRENLPYWFVEEIPLHRLFKTNADDQYQNEFAQTAWGAWHAAQYSSPDVDTVKAEKKRTAGNHKRAHPWRKTAKKETT